ncbi:MAG: PAS domain-containing protein [Treponema sp.]|jgi:two-component system phosphate regulon sensor histidine kinase PhoR|nr:PAS domain-containing protein [Treponema sp.]
MKRTIFGFACAMSGISILITAALIHLAFFQSFSQSLQKDTLFAAMDMLALYQRSGLEGLAALPHLGARITLIDANGAVLYDSRADAKTLPNHQDRPEVQSARRSGAGAAARFSSTLGKETRYHALLLQNGEVLRAAKTMDSVFALAWRMGLLSLGIACAVFMLAALAGERITRKMVEPINRIDLDHPEQNRVYDELSPLLRRIKEQNEAISAQMREMRQWRLEFAVITGNMREGLLILDQESRVLVCNRSACSLLEIRAGPVEGQDVLAVRRDEPFREAVEKARKGLPAETLLTVGNRRVQVFASPVWDRNSLQGLVLVAMDVTEREDRDRLRREFTANVSHELKTPLMAISGYAELMAGGIASHEDLPRFAQNIYQETRRLISLIKDLMTLSRLDERETTLVREPVDLDALTRRAIQQTAGAAGSRNISLSFTGCGERIQGIPPVLEEMIRNLLDNAVKYNVEGGAVQVAWEKQAGELILSVADQGIGIPPEEQDRIFERFYRVDKSRNRSVEGTGLGLSIVKHAAALHNGKIEVQSDGKTGTCFRVRIPGAGNFQISAD